MQNETFFAKYFDMYSLINISDRMTRRQKCKRQERGCEGDDEKRKGNNGKEEKVMNLRRVAAPPHTTPYQLWKTGFLCVVLTYAPKVKCKKLLSINYFSLTVNFWQNLSLFLDASTHLYKRVCPSVRRLVCRSVPWSVSRFFKSQKSANLMNLTNLNLQI